MFCKGDKVIVHTGSDYFVGTYIEGRMNNANTVESNGIYKHAFTDELIHYDDDIMYDMIKRYGKKKWL